MNKNNILKGIHISFSGLDGSGKSSCIKKVYEYLNSKYPEQVVCIDAQKPSKFNIILKNISKMLNRDMFELFGELTQVSFGMDLVYNYLNIILPNIKNNKIVISHRNALCCEAYSMLRDTTKEASQIIRYLTDGMKKPDLHFYLNICPEKAYKRVLKRSILENKELSINENNLFLSLVNDNYKLLLKERYYNCIIIDADNDMESICNIVIKYVEEYISNYV